MSQTKTDNNSQEKIKEAVNRLDGIRLTRPETATVMAIMFGTPRLPRPFPKSGYQSENGVKYKLVKKGTVLPTDEFRGSVYEEWCVAGGTERPVSKNGEFRRRVSK